MSQLIKNIVLENRAGMHTGVFSICSANAMVLRAAFRFAKKENIPLLIEATSNQVDQYGGYTGLTPSDFAVFVKMLAKESEFPAGKIILGGDHLGPNVWRNEDEASAMRKAETQISEYVKAGFTKIHLDASMPLGGEKTKKNGLLDAEIVAERAARLCEVSEKAARETGTEPVYVIGTDVPIPGGAKETEADIRITPPDELRETVEITRKKFIEKNLENAWERVVAVVVQPGVEFSDKKIFEYDPRKAEQLISALAEYDSLAFEAHSTDYQRAEKLREMVRYNFAVLKVGPWLTFAMREALFGLEYIERELIEENERSRLRETVEEAMLANPQYWENHYKGSEREKKTARAFSFSDRIRYYWSDKKVAFSVITLLENLKSAELPLNLVSQFFPRQYDAIRSGELELSPKAILYDKIEEVLKIYKFAVGEY